MIARNTFFFITQKGRALAIVYYSNNIKLELQYAHYGIDMREYLNDADYTGISEKVKPAATL